MEIVKHTGSVETPELRVTKPIKSLLVKTDATFAELTDETINVFVERANGRNVQIATRIPLKDFLLASTLGKSEIDLTGGISAICEICELGAIDLRENESIRIRLAGLKKDKTYSLYGLEFPVETDYLVRFDIKNVLAGEKSREFMVSEYESVVTSGVDNITECNMYFSNSQVSKYNAEELKALAFDIDSQIGSINNGSRKTKVYNTIVLPLSFGPNLTVTKLEIFTNGKQVQLLLKNDNKLDALASQAVEA